MGTPLDKNSSQTRKRIESHTFDNEEGEEYESSAFGGFGEYFRRKKIKLQNLDAELRAGSGAPAIFKGVVAHVSGYTQPPLHVLHQELVRHGAGFLQYLDGKTMATHIVASSLTLKKAVEFARYRVVKPAWVTDSIRAGRALPWSDYRVVDEGPRQKVLKFGDGGGLQSQAKLDSKPGYREQIQNSFYTSQFSKSSGAVDTQPSALATPTKEFFTSLSIATPVSAQTSRNDDTPMMDAPQSGMGDLDDEELLAAADGYLDKPSAPEDLKSAENSGAESPNGRKGADERPSLPRENMTSEEHNAWLLSDPHIRKASTANPDFLKQFYSESRLHHLSTWKAELKSKMQRLADERGPATRIVKRRPGARRYVMHVDFDSFFCAVSLKKKPEFIDKPAVVAHGTGSGSEIASCNYLARKFGVKNGMWMKRAMELCPELKVLPYDFPAYEETSRCFYEAILDVGGVVQSVSVDEAFLDVSAIVLDDVGSDGSGVNEGSIWREQERADQMAQALRSRIKEKTGCAVSVGIGGNILLAKVALRKAKPNGQHQVRPEEVLDLLAGVEVKSLPGVASSIGGRLEEMGITYVQDLRATTKERLVKTLGPKTGEKLWEYARGIDRAEVGDQPPRKSVSAEVNWGIRFTNHAEAEEFVMNLCKELERRLLNEQVKGTNLTMKIMRRALDAPLDPAKHLGHGKCDVFNKSATFGVASNSADAIGREAVGILRTFKFSPGDLRGLGVQMTKLVPMKATAGRPDGSQRRLQFAGVAKKSPATGFLVAAGDNSASPLAGKGQAQRTTESPFLPSRRDPVEDARSPSEERIAPNTSGSQRNLAVDPIEDGPLTPKKAKGPMTPAAVMSRHYQSDPLAKVPLNVSGSQFKFPPGTPGGGRTPMRTPTGFTPPGTQFVLPANPDPEIVAQLPKDIRARLMEQGATRSSKSRSPGRAMVEEREDHEDDEEAGPLLPSQIDPEVFNALPDDMKAEVLAQYGGGGGGSPSRGLSQQNNIGRESLGGPDRLAGAAAALPKRKGPVKRGRINGGIFKPSERRRDAQAGLMQTNFLGGPSRPQEQQGAAAATTTAAALPELEELDPDILAELPEDLRREVLEDHRRRRLAARSGLDAAGPPRRTDQPADGRPLPPPQQQQQRDLVSFLPLPRRAEFGGSGGGAATTREEVQDMVAAWHAKTARSGPHAADVDVLARYLGRVVGEERDMDKAAGIVRWLEWLVVNETGDGGAGARSNAGKGKAAWTGAVGSVKDAVQKAARQRGLKGLNI